MTKLRALVEEVDAALEIHLSGRSSTRFNRTVFILIDDCAELASKLYLVRRDANWSDLNKSDRPKAFRTVTADVKAALPAATKLLQRIEDRRERRNGFFHSTGLLDLTLHNNSVNEALADICDFGALLFGKEWQEEVASTGNMETSLALLQIDCRSRADPAITACASKVLKAEPRMGEKPKKTGCQVTHWPDDHHLILTLRNGGKALRDRLQALLD